MSMGDKINAAMAVKKINQTELAKLLGVTPQTVQQWVHNKTSPKKDNLKLLIKILNISADNLISDNSDNLLTNQSQNQAQALSVEDLSAKYNFIPRYHINGSAGNGEQVGDYEEIKDAVAFKKTWLSEKGLYPSQLSVISAIGNSMEPRIREGDILLINHALRDIIDGKVYLIRINNDLRIKRLFRRYDGALRITSDNQSPEYSDEIVPESAICRIEIIGRVIWIAGDI